MGEVEEVLAAAGAEGESSMAVGIAFVVLDMILLILCVIYNLYAVRVGESQYLEDGLLLLDRRVS